MRFCGRPPRFSHRRSSTADRDDGGLRGPAPGCVWGRVNLRDGADCPVDVLPAQSAAAGSVPSVGRARRDDVLRVEIQRVWDEHHQVYGPRKVWRQLRRDGHRVARCTVRRLMRAMGLQGAVRGRAWAITTQADRGAARPWISSTATSRPPSPISCGSRDFTYVATWRGFAYVAFPSSMSSRGGLSAGAWRRPSTPTSCWTRSNKPSTTAVGTTWATWCTTVPAATQYLSMRYTERLADAGIEPSVGSRGDSYDNALAESVNRALQNGGHSATRAVADGGGRGIRDAGVGRLVQHAPRARADRLRPTGRRYEARYYEQAAVA